MNASRADTVSFWLSIVWASIVVAVLGFQLVATDLPVSTFVFTIVTSWLGVYFSLTHLYAAFRRAQQTVREVQE